MLEVSKVEAVNVRAVQYPGIVTPFLLVFILYILLRVYFDGQSKNKSENMEIRPKNQIRNPDFPTVTHWFPFQVPFFDGILTFLRFGNYIVVAFEELQRKFGKVYWLPMGHLKVLVINDVNIIQALLSSSNPQHLEKPSELYDRMFTYWLRDGLINSKYPVWSFHRKILNHSFTYNCLRDYLRSVNKHGRELTKCLISATCKYGDKVEITDANLINKTIHFHLVKIVADVVMGPTSLSNDTAAEFTRHFGVLKQIMSEKLLNPFIRIPLLRYFNPRMKTQYEAVQYLDKFFNHITKMYRRQHELELPEIKITTEGGPHESIDSAIGEKPYRCLIQEMLYQGATNKEITDQVATFMVAGQETTNMALQMLMLNMALNPVHQSRCREEVDELINGGIKMGVHGMEDDLSNLNLSITDLSSLKYLERCVLESARLTPVVPMFGRMIGAPLKVSDDIELSSGTKVVVPVWMVHRDPNNFPKPEKFDPDRFLPENVKKRHSYSFIPFSGGMRNCIGNKLALTELKVILAFILRKFEIYSSDKLEDVPLLHEVTLRPQRIYNFVLKSRS